MGQVLRVYVEKKQGFDGEASALWRELTEIVGIRDLEAVRLLNRYDVEGASPELFETCIPQIFSEPATDQTYRDLPFDGDDKIPPEQVFAVEYLPGQFDQRADSAAQCIQLISQSQRPTVRTAKVYGLIGSLSASDIAAVKAYVINPIEAREASLKPLETLEMEIVEPEAVEVLEGFNEMDAAARADFITTRGLAMDDADLAFCQTYFEGEGRQPTITEIKVIDTYWSDHCRHTTFHTHLDDVVIDDDLVANAYDRYQHIRHDLGRDDKPVTLMELGTIAAKWLKSQGKLNDLDESDEINACTIKTKVDVNGKHQDWLYLFKNETHNHPTEIEPFGGAATCIGGAIRDPLSGRAYVYQAMRVTGAANPLVPVSETLPGKLPQRKLVTTAARGFSSYGNQIGLATGQVHEIYHPGYVAKRLEIGAVVGAVPARWVRREEPTAGDVIVLLGGRTGRDGIGGATGSSKAHSAESLDTCGAEVQKGNAPEERKIQRLFRNPKATRLIKRCNDFGAGGVAVAVGELAGGLAINLDAVPKKYEGLDGTELAISESQERMAVALAADDVDEFIRLANGENLECTPIATVTDDERVEMTWRGDQIVNLSRAFLASNGAPKSASATVAPLGSIARTWPGATLTERLHTLLTDINVASNKGLAEQFDSTIGAASVLMPFGGDHQLTPSLAMVAKLPVEGETTTCSGMAWGFNPYLTEANPYIGAYLAVVESVAKLIASGFSRSATHLTLQEYFPKLGADPARWGVPMAALLGALEAQLDLGVAAIGGKDSMSGSFESLDVPPTLVSFATAIGSVATVTSPEFKGANHTVICVHPFYRNDGLLPEVDGLTETFDAIEGLIASGAALAVSTPGYGRDAEALFKMCVGSTFGFKTADDFDVESLFVPAYGSFIVELADEASAPQSTDNISVVTMGTTTSDFFLTTSEESIYLGDLQEAWEGALESVFPYRTPPEEAKKLQAVDLIGYHRPPSEPAPHAKTTIAKPRVLIPVFPGTNCEYDTAAAFERAGARPEVIVINNLSAASIAESVSAVAKAIKKSQIVMLPGGFSAGDEPDGSAKFIAAFFRAPEVTEAIREMLQMRDGLMLGICNGFQALIKLGLVPYGDILDPSADAPTLTYNEIGRHQSRLVHERICSNLSPWMTTATVGDVYNVAISHGEGRFVASQELLDDLVAKGQVATQYVDESGRPSMDRAVNPNGSALAIEGITSPDGRILGKMGHTERTGDGLYKNVPGEHFHPLFEAGVGYFTS